ncbi:MAG TPA: hypothetical protein VLK85_09880 [Ramlibacter sp.]|nr:hypothetical protein [Ramlibacter sp.]
MSEAEDDRALRALQRQREFAQESAEARLRQARTRIAALEATLRDIETQRRAQAPLSADLRWSAQAVRYMAMLAERTAAARAQHEQAVQDMEAVRGEWLACRRAVETVAALLRVAEVRRRRAAQRAAEREADAAWLAVRRHGQAEAEG